MTQRRVSTKWLCSLMSALVFCTLAPIHASQVAASVQGIVVSSESQEPVEGVQILLGNPTDGSIASSTETGSDGRFQFDDVSAATYQVAVQSDAGLYVVDSPLAVSGKGNERPLHLVIEGNPKASAVSTSGRIKASGLGGIWSNPLTASLLVIGGAIIVGVLVEEASGDEEDNTPASNSIPNG